MKEKILGYTLIFFVFAAVVSILYYEQTKQTLPDLIPAIIHKSDTSGAKTFTSAQYGFEFNYDKNYVFDQSSTQTNFFVHPAVTLVSVSIPQNSYPKTNFGSANFTIATQRQSQASSCEAAAKTQEVNGINFHESEETQGAAGTTYKTKIYRTFYNDICYEASLTAGIANIGNYDPGSVTAVNETDVWNKLQAVFDTFKFTGIVKCAGFAGIPCPTSGYVCKPEGSYPDAMTICEKQKLVN
jgi:hypothetical protein